VLARRKWYLLVALTLTTSAALLLTRATPPLYRSEATLLLAPRASAAGMPLTPLTPLTPQVIASLADVASDRATALAVLRRYGAEFPLTTTALQRRISATAVDGTLLLRVTVSDSDPAQAQQLADAVATTFAELLPRLQGPAVRASLISPATRPLAATRPPVACAVGAGLLAGLLVGVALALLAERLDSRVNTATELETALGVPVLAAIPRFDARRAPLPLLGRRWSAPVEAFRKLRANVSFLSAGWTIARGAVCYVITSPVADEGKSTIAANLALAAAQAGQRVVLLDGDLRKPAVHRLFGLPPRVGATTVLVGRTTVAAALQQPSDAPLSVLTSGQLPPNPAELVGSLAMEALVRELRQEADLILIDCPPILPVADPMLVARLADGVLVVARAGATTTERLAAARAAVQRAGVPLLGAILNAVNPRDSDPAANAWYGQGIERPRGMSAIAPRTTATPSPSPSPTPGPAAGAGVGVGVGAGTSATAPAVTPSRAQTRHARRRHGGLAGRGMPVPRQRH